MAPLQSKQKLPKANITQKNITQKNQPKIKVVLVIVVTPPPFLGPKMFIICSPAGPCFLCGLLLSWMSMLFRLWWWMRTG